MARSVFMGGLLILPFDRPTFVVPVGGNLGQPRGKNVSVIVSALGKEILGHCITPA
jgi:hypothetical protein